MTEKKIIAIVGATGSQGGGLVRAILADPDHEFAARALTRNAQSGKAREFAASGARWSKPTSTTRPAWCERSKAPMARLS